MRFPIRFIIFTALILVASAAVKAQNKDQLFAVEKQEMEELFTTAFSADSSRLYNSPEVPARLGVTKDGTYFRLDNVSGGTIRTFHFACVSLANGGVRVIRSFEPQVSYQVERTLERGGYLIFGGVDPGIIECQKASGRLSVYRLFYADGTKWSLAPGDRAKEGEEDDLSVEQRVSIKFKDKPLFTVLSHLIVNYDVPIGFEESRLDFDHPYFDILTNRPPGDLVPHYSRLELKSNNLRSEEHLITVDFTDAKLNEVLSSIVGQMRNYDWELIEGVVNIFPTRERDPRFRQLLDIKVAEFHFPADFKLVNLQKSVFDLPEFQAFLSSNRLSVDYSLIGPWFEHRSLDSAIKISGVSFRSLLNGIVKAKRGSWILRRNKHNRSRDREYIDIVI